MKGSLNTCLRGSLSGSLEGSLSGSLRGSPGESLRGSLSWSLRGVEFVFEGFLSGRGAHALAQYSAYANNLSRATAAQQPHYTSTSAAGKIQYAKITFRNGEAHAIFICEALRPKMQ